MDHVWFEELGICIMYIKYGKYHVAFSNRPLVLHGCNTSTPLCVSPNAFGISYDRSVLQPDGAVMAPTWLPVQWEAGVL